MQSRASHMMPYTYSGLLDDVVARYPVADVVDQAFFNKMLAKNIFFSGGILLNDGYLVNHPMARRELMREDSILRIMMRGDFIRLLTRMPVPDGLVEMTLDMAAQGNASFQTLLGSSEWEDVQPTLKRVGPYLFRKNNLIPWPGKKMHVGFVKLISRIFDKTHSDLGLRAASDVSMQELGEAFEATRPQESGPRDKFEKVVSVLAPKRASDPRNAAIELMNIANQCYHYNFGMCLSPEFEQPISVDTTIGLAFEDILDIDEVYEGAIEGIIPRVPAIHVPREVPFERGDIFAPILDPSTRLGEAKEQYLWAIDDLFAEAREGEYSETRVNGRLKDARECADRYRNLLAEHFAQHITSRFWEAWMDSALAIGVGALNVAVGAGAIAGIAVGVASTELLKNPRQFLLRRIRERDFQHRMSEPPLDPQAGDIKLEDIKPLFASMAFNKAAVERFVKTVPDL